MRPCISKTTALTPVGTILPKHGIIACFIVALLGEASPAFAADFFRYQGPYTRASSGAYLTESRSGEASIHNPANLTLTQSSMYGDIGLANWTYVITAAEKPDDRGAMRSPILPLVSAGGSYRPNHSFAIGGAFIPLGMPGLKTKAKNMPQHTGGAFEQVNVDIEQTSYKAALGAGFKASNAFRAGVSALIHSTARKMTVFSPDTGEASITTEEKSLYITPRLGFSGRLASRLNWAFVYEPSSVSTYKVTNTFLVSQQSATMSGHEYHAESFEVGASVNLLPGVTPYGQYVREQWVKGTFKSTPPTERLNGAETPTHFLNTNNFVGGIKLKTKKRQILYLGMAKFQGNKGDGVKDTDGTTLFAGVAPSDFDGLNRMHYTLGYKMPVGKNTLLAYTSYISAVKMTAEDSPSPGYYNLKVFLVGFGLVID